MVLLTALQVHNNPNAPLIIIAFILFTAALYCAPTVSRLVKSMILHTRMAAIATDDTIYVCHDEAFISAKG